MIFRRFLSFIIAAAFVLGAGPAFAQFGKPRVKASLVQKAAAEPGKAFDLAFKMVHPEKPEKVHTYGQKPGEAGIPTKIEWKLPPGWTAAPTRWAKSSKVGEDIHEGTVEHLTAITVPGSAAADAAVKIEAIASWLECDDKGCMPANNQSVTLLVTVGAAVTGAPAAEPAGKPAEESAAPAPEKKEEKAPDDEVDPFSDPDGAPEPAAPAKPEEAAGPKVKLSFNVVGGIQPGKPFNLRLTVDHAEGYHTYGGKTELEGQNMSVKWTLPDGWTAGGPRWAKPNYPDAGEFQVYEGKVTHLFPITPVAGAAQGSEHTIKALVAWQQCTEFTCEQKSAEFDVPVKIGGEPLVMRSSPPATPGPPKIDLGGGNDPETKPAPTWEKPPETKSEGSRFTVDEAMGAVFTPGQPDYLTLDGKIEEKPNLLTAILFAFLGGMILNLMPCVFPVLGIKVLGFVKLGGDDSGKIRMHGFVFSAGVVLSLLALAGALLIIQAVSGSKQGWGFLQQSAGFTAGITILMIVLGLNLAGLFEMGSTLSNVGGQLQGSRKGYAGSFLSGVLTTIVATPCSGPFLGAAIGYAFAQPPLITLAVFFFFGLGIAAPYMVLVCFPALIRRLPKPGAWMETFKKAMSFLMFATAVYFLNVFTRQAGEFGQTLLLLALVLAGITVWIYGYWCTPFRSARSRVLGYAAVVVFAGLSFWTAQSAASQKSELAEANARAELYARGLAELKKDHPTLKLPEILQSGGDKVVWEEFSPERVRELREQGRMIYMDFTAAWCATCIANKAICFEVKGSETSSTSARLR